MLPSVAETSKQIPKPDLENEDASPLQADEPTAQRLSENPPEAPLSPKSSLDLARPVAKSRGPQTLTEVSKPEATLAAPDNATNPRIPADTFFNIVEKKPAYQHDNVKGDAFIKGEVYDHMCHWPFHSFVSAHR